MPDIFISYSRRDLHIVEKLRADLGAAGFDVWQDKEQIKGGHRWRLQIEKAIEDCVVFLLVASKNSYRTDYVWDEVEAALHDTKPLMVLTVGNAQKPNGLKWLSKYHTIFHQANGQHVCELAEALANFDILPASHTSSTPISERAPETPGMQDQEGEDERSLEDSSDRLLGEHPELVAIEQQREALERERQQLKAKSKKLKFDTAQEMLERERALLEKQKEQLQRFEQERKEELEEEQTRLASERAELDAENAKLEQKRDEHQRLAGQTEELQADQTTRLQELDREIQAAETKLAASQEKLSFQEHKNEVTREEEAGRYRALIEATQQEEQNLSAERRELEKKISELKRTQRRPLALICAGILVTCVVAGVTAYLTKPAFLSHFWKKASQEELWEKMAGERASLEEHGEWDQLLGTAVIVEDRFNDSRHFIDAKSGELDESKQQEFRKFFSEKRGELDSDVQEAVDALLAEVKSGTSLAAEEEERVVESLKVIIDWEVAPRAALLHAVLRMPALTSEGNYAAALEDYLRAVRSDSGAEVLLEGQLRETSAAMLGEFNDKGTLDRQSEVSELMDDLPKSGIQPASDAALLRESIRAELLRSEGKPVEALEAVLSAADSQPGWFPKLEPLFNRCLADLCKLDYPETSRALQLVAKKAESKPPWSKRLESAGSEIGAAIAARPSEDVIAGLELFLGIAAKLDHWKSILKPPVSALLPLVEREFENWSQDDISLARPVLVQVALSWELGAAYVILANAIDDAQAAMNYHKQAADLGDLDSKAIVGGRLAVTGYKNDNKAELEEGIQMVQEAVEAENATGFLEMGKLHAYGWGVETDISGAVELLTEAEENLGKTKNMKRHAESQYELGRALLRQGQEEKSKDLLAAAAKHLDSASVTLATAYVYLFFCYCDPVMDDPIKAREALEKGASSGDLKSLHTLGLFLYSGIPPFDEDVSTGRGHILDAARAGFPSAQAWCLENFPKIKEVGNAADKRWVEQNWRALEEFSR